MKDSGKRRSALQREVQQLRQRLAETAADRDSLHRAERALAQYWSVLDAILSGTSDLYAIKDTNYSYQAANRAFCRFMGAAEHEIRGRGDFELFPPRLAEIFHRDDVRVVQVHAPVHYESRLPFQDTSRWLRFEKRPVPGANGRCAGILCVIQDVSELARCRHQQTLLLDAAHRGYWCTDQNGTIVDVNAAYCAETGYARDDLIGRPMSDIEILGSSETHVETNKRIIRDGFGAYTTMHRTRTNTILEFEVDAIHLPDRGGRFHRYFRLAGAGTAEPQEAAHGGVEPSSAPAHRRVLNLNDVIVKALQGEIDQIPPGISIRKVLDPNLRNTVANPAQLAQIILNITTNAVEAMDGRGHITYTTRNVELTREWLADTPQLKPGHYVYLAIADTGRGIAPALLGKVFDPFITTKFKGRGMGLASVARNVEEHHGLVTVKSEVDRGATFTVYLPATDARVVSTAAAPQIPSGTESILFIDPETRVLDEARAILERLAYTVVPANALDEALLHAQDRTPPFDAVVVDVACARQRPPHWIQRLRETNPGIRILLAGSGELEGWIQDLLDAGAETYLRKPFRPEVLAPRIRQVLDSAH